MIRPLVMDQQAGWIHTPTPKHVCITPNKTEMDKQILGSVWKCTCGAYWALRTVTTPRGEAEKYMEHISPKDAAQIISQS